MTPALQPTELSTLIIDLTQERDRAIRALCGLETAPGIRKAAIAQIRAQWRADVIRACGADGR